MISPRLRTSYRSAACPDMSGGRLPPPHRSLRRELPHSSGVLTSGDKVLAVNGCTATGVPMTANMLRQAEGTIALELLRAKNRQSTRAPSSLHGSAPCSRRCAEASPAASPGAANATAAESAAVQSDMEGADMEGDVEQFDAEPQPPRPWTPRTQAAAQAEMQQALDAGDFPRLAAVTSRVHAESERLRQARACHLAQTRPLLLYLAPVLPPLTCTLGRRIFSAPRPSLEAWQDLDPCSGALNPPCTGGRPSTWPAVTWRLHGGYMAVTWRLHGGRRSTWPAVATTARSHRPPRGAAAALA